MRWPRTERKQEHRNWFKFWWDRYVRTDRDDREEQVRYVIEVAGRRSSCSLLAVIELLDLAERGAGATEARRRLVRLVPPKSYEYYGQLRMNKRWARLPTLRSEPAPRLPHIAPPWPNRIKILRGTDARPW
jgi:hypothetical protein